MFGSGLEVRIDERPGVIILELRGEAGVRQLGQLQNTAGQLLAARPRLVVIDLERLDYMGPLPMRALAQFRQALIRRGGRVVLAGMSASLRQLFRAEGIDGLFPKVYDVRIALARCRIK